MIVGQQYGPLLRLHEVRRWSMVQMHREQSVAEHSFNVMVIAEAIAQFIKESVSYSYLDKDLMREWAMYHDAEEYWTTDIPSPIKATLRSEGNMSGLERYIFERCEATNKRYNELKKLVEDTDADAVVKLADRTETLAYFLEYSVKQDPSVTRYLREALETATSRAVRLCGIRDSVTDANLRNMINEVVEGSFLPHLTRVRCGQPYFEPVPRAAEDPDCDDDIPF